uniref:Uncharacterized protein n=1 Tax=Ciona savignyi TaxID=51511 RepID=H2ZPV5_CIOSA
MKFPIFQRMLLVDVTLDCSSRLQHLSANRLSAIEPGIFTTISYNLKKLDLTRNEITLLKHGLFWGCSTLVTLELGHNMMSYISEEQEFPFQGLLSLRVLRLNSNRLVGLPGDSRAWNDMAKLEELHLSGNLLQVLPEFKPVTRLPGIKFIDLSANLITRLGSETFRGFPSLEKLDASNNAITEISWDALAQN